MPLGFRGEGVLLSAPMAASATIAKGDVVAFDADARLVRAPAEEKNPIGVAAESHTTLEGQHPHVAYVRHGVVGVRAASAVRAGDAVRVGANSGEVAPLPDQPVDEGGAAAYTLHWNQKLGLALQDIAAGAVGDVFVGA